MSDAWPKQVFAQLLRSDASRCGYYGSMDDSPRSVFPSGIYPIPLHLAPAASLDGVWIDTNTSPSTNRDLAAVLQTLGEDGVVIALLSAKSWQAQQLIEVCRSAAVQILHLSRTTDAKSIVVQPNGLPASSLFWARHFGSHHLLIGQKQPLRRRLQSGIRLSIVVPVDAPFRLSMWQRFLDSRKLYGVEVIAASDSIRRSLIETGGRWVLLDFDQDCDCRFLFDVIDRQMTAESAVDVLAGFVQPKPSSMLRRVICRSETGFVNQPAMLLLSDKAVQSVIDAKSVDLADMAAIGRLLRRRFTVDEVEFRVDEELAVYKEKPV